MGRPGSKSTASPQADHNAACRGGGGSGPFAHPCRAPARLGESSAT